MVDDARTEPTRRKPKLGILIRLAIYIPALGFFGWRAWERFANEREAADEVFRERVSTWLANPPQVMLLPNGEALPMLTPEQAAAQGYPLPASVLENDEPAEPPTAPPTAPPTEAPSNPPTEPASADSATEPTPAEPAPAE